MLFSLCVDVTSDAIFQQTNKLHKCVTFTSGLLNGQQCWVNTLLLYSQESVFLFACLHSSTPGLQQYLSQQPFNKLWSSSLARLCFMIDRCQSTELIPSPQPFSRAE